MMFCFDSSDAWRFVHSALYARKLHIFLTIDFLNPAKCSRVFELDPEAVKPHTLVCSRHFMNDNPKNDLRANIGGRFASPVKKGLTGLQGLLKGSRHIHGKGYSNLQSILCTTGPY